MYNKERSFAFEKAFDEAFSFAKSRRLRINYHDVGSKIRTSSCILKDQHGRETIGRGKGLGQQSNLSAIYEAFEHYYYEFEDLTNLGVVKSLNLTGEHAHLVDSSPDFLLLGAENECFLNMIRFDEINGSDFIEFPAILVNPNYRPKYTAEDFTIKKFRLRRYSSNSGTASGLSESDAILHGILEIIERDAISVELLRTVIKYGGHPTREVVIKSLPIKLRGLHNDVVDETGGEINLWNITSDLNIPTFLCSLTTYDKKFRFFGAGTSLWCSYAAERAILEAVQGYHIQTLMGVQFQAPLKDLSDNLSLYRRCQLDEGYFLPRSGNIMINFQSLEEQYGIQNTMDVDTQMLVILRALKDKGIRVYYRNIMRGDITVSQVLAPRLERFFLVSHGIPVAPSARGRTFLKEST
jgi:ribosomal protein S12 methylthiotransferase accessory factor